MSGALAVSREHTEGLISGLSSSMDILKENQEALASQLNEPVVSENPPIFSGNKIDDDDFDFGVDEDDDTESYEDDDDAIEDDDDFDYDDID